MRDDNEELCCVGGGCRFAARELDELDGGGGGGMLICRSSIRRG